MAEAATPSLLYLYGVVPAGAPPPPAELRGVEDRPVRLLDAGELAGIVSAVPAEVYAEETLNERLGDLDWVGQRGVAHERVLSWFADRGPVVPLSLFSLHRDAGRVRERLAAAEAGFADQLHRVTGRREWGLRIWRREAEAAERLVELSPRLQALQAEIAAAPPGRRYLLGRKLETVRAEEARGLGAAVGREALESLRAAADEVALIPHPPSEGAERTLVFYAAFLVAESGFPAFQERVSELASRYRPAGFEWEFTGPWPPYHFVRA